MKISGRSCKAATGSFTGWDSRRDEVYATQRNSVARRLVDGPLLWDRANQLVRPTCVGSYAVWFFHIPHIVAASLRATLRRAF